MANGFWIGAAVVGGIAISGAIFWAGSINEHKSNVEKFMEEIRGDLKYLRSKIEKIGKP